MTKTNDAALIRRFQNGDKSSLDTLIMRHHDRAYQFAYKLTRDQDRAADVVAESFFRVCKALGRFQGSSSFSTWLYRIIANCSMDHHKKQVSRPALSLEESLEVGGDVFETVIVNMAPTTHALLEKAERERLISAAIAELPELHRKIILKHYIEMLSYDEIAASLGVPVGTVKSRLNRARVVLRGLLEEDRSMLVA